MPDRLELALIELGARVEFPATPELSVPSRRSEQPSTRRMWALAGAALAAVVILLAIPGTRSAIADLFGTFSNPTTI